MNKPQTLSLAAFACLASLPAGAQTTLTVPSEVAFISNPTLTTPSRGNVAVIRTSPSLQIQKVDGPIRTEWSLGATIERSSNTDRSANRTLPRAGFLWESTGPVSVLALRASAEVASTRETEFAEFGRVARDTNQRIGALGVEWTRNISEGSRWVLGATHRAVSYQGGLFTDFDETSGSAAYSTDLSPTARLSVGTTVATVNPAGLADNSSRAGITVGYETDLSEALLFAANAGFVRTDAATSSTNPVGGLRLTYTGERLRYTLGWTREVSAGGTVVGFTRVQNINASVTLPLSADNDVSFGISHAKLLDGARDAGATAFLRWSSVLSPFWTFTAGLEHRRAMPFTGPTARGQAVILGLTYSHPDF